MLLDPAEPTDHLDNDARSASSSISPLEHRSGSFVAQAQRSRRLSSTSFARGNDARRNRPRSAGCGAYYEIKEEMTWFAK